MVKNDAHYIEEIIKNLDFILEHMEKISKEDFEKNEVLQDSMIFRLIQVSETSKNLTEQYKNQNADVPWSDITALRNRLVHDYGNVDMTIVYDTLTKDIHDLRERLKLLLY